MDLAVVDSTVVLEAVNSTNTTAVDEAAYRQEIKERSHTVAKTWLADNLAKIRLENLDRLINLLTSLHESCLTRVREAVTSAYTADSSSRSCRPQSRQLATIAEDLADLQAECSIRDGIATAFCRFDDTRQQAVSSVLNVIRSQIGQARVRAVGLESDLASAELVRNLI